MSRSRLRSGVDLHELVMSPFYGLFGSHALDRLRIHVDDDVFGFDFGSIAVRATGKAFEAADAWQIPERAHHRINVPHRILLPFHGGATGKALLRGEPLLEYCSRMDPSQEI